MINMILEESTHYTAVNGRKVVTRFIADDMKFYYQFELIKILEIQPLSSEDKQAILEEHNIISGLIDDIRTPAGYRHKESGRCVGLNISLTGDKLENLLRGFSIETNSP